MRVSVLILCTLLGFSSLGQKLIMDVLDPRGANPSLQSGSQQQSVEGSVFLTDWRVGYIYYGSKREEKKLRYNAYKDAIHIMNAQGQELVIEKGQVESFSVVDNGKEYKFKWITDIPDINFAYLQVLYEGKVKVYYRHGRKLRQSNWQTEGYGGSNANDQIVHDDAFVIELPNQTKHLTNGRKKEILSIFADRKKELEQYIKAKKLDTRKFQDLMDLIEKYESLIGE